MVRLTLRGMALKQRFEAAGLAVIEGYPGATQDLLGIPRRKKDVAGLRQGLVQFGITLPEGPLRHDELDAVTAALVGLFHCSGESEAIGPAEEVPIILPRLAGMAGDSR